MSIATYLKKHSEALVKDVGIEAACTLTGRSKATLGRYYSDADEHGDRFMPIDVVAQLEAAAEFPHVTAALADMRGITLSYDMDRKNSPTHGVNHDVVALAQRFAMLMSEYQSGHRRRQNLGQRGQAAVARGDGTATGTVGDEVEP